MSDDVVLLRDGPTGVLLEHSPLKNPFRQQVLKGQFDGIVGAYDIRHKDVVRLGRDGRYRRHMGNAWANNFWRGFDGVLPGRWDAASKQTPAYACWRAGQAIRAALPPLEAKASDEPIVDDGTIRLHLYDPTSANPMPLAARRHHEYDLGMDYEATPMPRILLGMLANASQKVVDHILPALGMEGAVLFCHDDPDGHVGRYAFGTSSFPVVGIDLERIKAADVDTQSEIETTIVHELAHAWLEPRIDEDMMMDHDQAMEDAVERFARVFSDTGIVDLSPLESYAAAFEEVAPSA